MEPRVLICLDGLIFLANFLVPATGGVRYCFSKPFPANRLKSLQTKLIILCLNLFVVGYVILDLLCYAFENLLVLLVPLLLHSSEISIRLLLLLGNYIRIALRANPYSSV